MSFRKNVPTKNVKRDSHRHNLQSVPTFQSFREFQLMNCPAHKRMMIGSAFFAHYYIFRPNVFTRFFRSSQHTFRWKCVQIPVGSAWPLTYLRSLTHILLFDLLKGTLWHKKTPITISCMFIWHFHDLFLFFSRQRLPEHWSMGCV